MLDFLMVSHRLTKNEKVEIYPKFIVRTSKDLMIRGGDFYAIWDDSTGLWCTSEDTALQLIDKELDEYRDQHAAEFNCAVRVLHLWDSDSGMIDKWHKFCQRQMRDSFKPLDERLIFANTDTKKEDYASKKLPYAIGPGDISAYDELMRTLYLEDERRKIEWAIGAVVSGDSVNIQKFLVLYGSAGTGKSTVLNIIQKLFAGYYSVFDARALGMASNSFALEPFKTNPLVALQHDGDLSRIEDNTRLNSVVSHELMTVNEKFKSAYASRFNCFLFMGTNKPVKITDAKSGILRRLIDVSPSGNKLPTARYNRLVKQVDFELGAIAQHCLDVYESNVDIYNNYIPTRMLGASNDFYNFILDAYEIFKKEDGTSLKAAWELYRQYCEEAGVLYPYPQRVFKEELKNYFETFEERRRVDGELRVRNYYSGFLSKKFEQDDEMVQQLEEAPSWLRFDCDISLLNFMLGDCPAQYASEKETPRLSWDNVTLRLRDLDPRELHYVRVPECHVVIDFDICDENGEKSFERNYEEASKWPPTYAELSKSGKGIHLHYIYAGDVTKLSRIYAENIEIKVFTGKSSLRRKLTKCNDIPVATISSGLPVKGDTKVVNHETVKNEKALRTIILRSVNKEYLPGTKPSVEFIFKILQDAYDSGMEYDVENMHQMVLAFAMRSTHHKEYCVNLVSKMKFKSEGELTPSTDYAVDAFTFFDIEVYPNLLVIVYKPEDKPWVSMINPDPEYVKALFRLKLIGFNNRKYDNHILYARGEYEFNNTMLFELSQKIIAGSKSAFFGEAYNLSYADIYDFSSVKQSLKKFEIDLGLHHQELGLPWDKPVPEDKWDMVVEYCVNDVLATEAVFKARKQDFVAREILAALSGLTVNDTTRQHTTKIIFGDERHPKLEYTDLSQTFPGYEFVDGHNMYRGEDVGFGGYVYAEPGMYTDVALLDIASMHPHSIIAMNVFGEYTQRFKELLNARMYIKHKEFDKARELLDGKLAQFLEDESQADDLAQALKIVINSVYGYTSAAFENPFKDPRNKNNIVALRGALFMLTLRDEVQKRGFTVAHIKTDSIKIPNATPEIIEFCMDFAKQYGYTFEHEDTYAKMCLVNDAVYIAKYSKPHIDKKTKEEIWWTATGAQFQVPYVFKTLFSHEMLEFRDLCEAKTVTTALYLDMNENLPEGEHCYQFVGKVGLFCPIRPGCGGGILYREKEGKFSAATGTKGYRWLESEVVTNLGKEGDIDMSYYQNLADEALKTIGQYGDIDWFRE